MATSPAPTTTPAPRVVERTPSPLKPAWQNYGTPLIVVLLAIAVLVTITRNWNGWEGGHVEQTTNDAYVRGDLTPLSTKVPGLVREVKVNDYQGVHFWLNSTTMITRPKLRRLLPGSKRRRLLWKTICGEQLAQEENEVLIGIIRLCAQQAKALEVEANA